MTDNRTTKLLKDYAFALQRLEYDVDKPGSNMTLGEYEAEEKRVTDEYAQAIAATLGSPTLNANLEQALSFMRIWISDDAHLGESELSAAFEKAEGLRKLDAIESAIAATLGSGMLTAEQVREAIERHSLSYGEIGRCFHDASWQAIADELNAMLGDECEMEELERWDGSDPHYRCKACGHENNEDYLPNYCPECGRKIRKAVKR